LNLFKKTIMEDIIRLQNIPIDLLKAKNVTYIVIDGMTLNKKMLIEKAQRNAIEILKYEQFLSFAGKQYLQTIINY
tara:strand:- start:7249 stop:7476 length:228 start_codon:yes stop_codon:yes gene_type:complete